MSAGNERVTLLLTLTASDGREFFLEFNQGQDLLAGRDLGAEVVIPDGRVSRHHSSFSLESSGLWIEDLHSQNGTFVNSEKIQRTRLDHGDVISLGGYEFRVRIGGETETGPAEPGELSLAASEALASIIGELPAHRRGEDLEPCLAKLADCLGAAFTAAFRVDHETMTVRPLVCLDLADSQGKKSPTGERTLPSVFLDRIIETGETNWLRPAGDRPGPAAPGSTDAVAAAPAIIERVVCGLVYMERKASFKPLDLEILSAFTAYISGFFAAGKTSSAGRPASGFYKRLGDNETLLERSGSIRAEGGVAEVAKDLVDTVGDQPDL